MRPTYNDEVKRRGVALPTNEVDLSQSSTSPPLWLTEAGTRDRSNRFLEGGERTEVMLRQIVENQKF
jgi:hypothetical protein